MHSHTDQILTSWDGQTPEATLANRARECRIRNFAARMARRYSSPIAAALARVIEIGRKLATPGVAKTQAKGGPARRARKGGTPIMLNPLIIGLITFAVIQAGAVTGWAIRQRLPKHHLTDETKGLVSVSMAVVATVSALVLGLLISNANTSFSVLE